MVDGLEDRWAVFGSLHDVCVEAQSLLQRGSGALAVLAALIRTATVFKEVLCCDCSMCYCDAGCAIGVVVGVQVAYGAWGACISGNNQIAWMFHQKQLHVCCVCCKWRYVIDAPCERR